MIFSVMIFSFIFTGNVSAKELVQFRENGYQTITTEMIYEVIKNNNVDTSIFSSYIVLGYEHDQNKYIDFLLLDTNRVLKKFDYVDISGLHYFVSSNDFYGLSDLNDNSIFNSDSVFTKYRMFNMFKFTFEKPENYVYYSNIDIYDSGRENIYFKKNSDEVIVPLEPGNTINKFTSFYSSFLTILGDFCKTIIKEPLLMFPFALCILIVIIFVFKSLF